MNPNEIFAQMLIRVLVYVQNLI